MGPIGSRKRIRLQKEWDWTRRKGDHPCRVHSGTWVPRIFTLEAETALALYPRFPDPASDNFLTSTKREMPPLTPLLAGEEGLG